MVQLDIYSDPICPWCYIGKAHLMRALEASSGHPFTIYWHPFQLNPDMPAKGMDRTEYLELKFGGKEGAVSVYSKIAEAAEQAGLEIDFAAIKRTPNTLNAHRLIHWAEIEGKQMTVVSALFEAYFKKGLDIGDDVVLLEIAKEAGLDDKAIKQLLSSDADCDFIREEDKKARAAGMQAVPCFIINREYVIQGAQDYKFWSNVIAEISKNITQQEH